MDARAPNEYVLGHSQSELERLCAQGRWLGELTEQVLRTAGIGPGMRVLDAGCGAGDVSFLTARLVGPQGEVVGVDRAGDAIALASRRAADAGLSNVRFVAQDLNELTLDGRFDAVVGRLVLMYFPDPVAVLRRLIQQVRPGGLIAFHEFDLAGAISAPRLPQFTAAVTRLAETLRRGSANPHMGLRLPQTFRAAGLPVPGVLVHSRMSSCGDTSCFEQVAGVTRTLVPMMDKLGVPRPDDTEVDSLAKRLADEAAALDATAVAPLFVGAYARVGG